MTRGDSQVKEAIREFMLRHGYAPSYEDISAMINCSVDFAKSHVQKLLADGELESEHPGQQRAYRIPGIYAEPEKKTIKSKLLGL